MKKSAGCEWDFRQKVAGKRYYKALNFLIYLDFLWVKGQENLQITTVNINLYNS